MRTAGFEVAMTYRFWAAATPLGLDLGIWGKSF